MSKRTFVFSLAIAACIYSVYLNAQDRRSAHQHSIVYQEAGRFGGWPANHGIWSWGDEILVGFSAGYDKDLGNERHNIDPEKPEVHLFARSLDGGVTWRIEHPAGNGGPIAARIGKDHIACQTLAPKVFRLEPITWSMAPMTVHFC